MKKRAQLPNAQTYTLIFRGCAASQHASQAVYQATRLYHAMLASDRIKPNTMHMNAVLTVCSRARDIESLFSIVNTANQRTRCPDNLTYTIVLNGLRYATVRPGQQPAVKGADGGDDVHVDKESVAVSIRRARAVWEEVVKYWRQGLVVVDEELVCAMGRILRMGHRGENDDILSLVQQTMGIQRPDRPAAPAIEAPKVAEEARGVQQADEFTSSAAEIEVQKELSTKTETEVKKETAIETLTQDKAEKAEAETLTEPVVAEPVAAEPALSEPAAAKPGATTALAKAPKVPPPGRVSQFDPTPGTGALAVQSSSSRTMYAQPGPNTLSLILMSISSTGKTSLAPAYWKILTGPPYNVVPDSENWYQLLRTLRRGHASTKMLELILKMPAEYMNAKTFQLAMATCAADNLNEHAFSNAGKVLDLMGRTLIEPDAMTMRLYLQTALTSNRRYRDTLKKEVDNPMAREKAKLAFGRQLVRALSRLWDPLRLASNAVGFAANWQAPATKMPMPTTTAMATTSGSSSSSSSSGSSGTDEVYNRKRELAALARMMVSAADMVVTEVMADEATIKDLRISRNLLNRQIGRFYEKREEMEPNLRTGRPSGRGRRQDDSQPNSRRDF